MLLKQALSEEQPSINLTPMLDVVFNLIVFFMVGTKFVDMEHHIPIQTPKVSEAGALIAAPSKKQVHVYRDGQITLEGQTLTLAELTRQLRAACVEYPELGVLVRGDAEGKFQYVADAISAVTQAGVSETSICVRLEPGVNPKR